MEKSKTIVGKTIEIAIVGKTIETKIEVTT